MPTTFEKLFHDLTGHWPFPWQIELFNEFNKWFSKNDFQKLPPCNLPTGLGKTNVMAIWLIALAEASEGVHIPRRLVYVVNRRTVVDQATREAEKLRDNLKNKPELANFAKRLRELGAITAEGKDEPLAISTLRGQFADNREWSADPARPAIIVGTVDMIGSRLLFSGYGQGFKSRPLHAGFLGQDALLIHDEAHLEPAFQELITDIQAEQRCKDFQPLRVMELTATSRSDNDQFGLTDADREHEIVKKRIHAKKGIVFHPIDEKKTAAEVANLALERAKTNPGDAILVFLRRVEDVTAVVKKLPSDSVAQLTGTIRGLERDALVKTPIFQRFLPDSDRDPDESPAEGTAYLVCTSAGEVGVNISADHLICDLSTFDSMAQRLGRVNRFGDGDAKIDVVYPTSFSDKDALSPAREKTLALLRSLPKRADERYDASPAALGELSPNERLSAFAQQPEVLPTSNILFDAWALTSVCKALTGQSELPGRPPVADWLHGVREWEPPETHVAWREEVELLKHAELSAERLAELLNDYPLKPHELLRDNTYRIRDRLDEIADGNESLSVWLVTRQGDVTQMALGELVARKPGGKKNDYLVEIENRTIILPPAAGGLTKAGTLGSGDPSDRHDVGDELTDDRGNKLRERRTAEPDDHAPPAAMRLVAAVPLRPPGEEDNANDEEGEESAGPKTRLFFTQIRAADDDLSKTSLQPISWDDHTNDVTENIERIVERLKLSPELQQALIIAAKLHDLGKKREVWQRSIGNPNPTDWHAKSGKDLSTGKRWRYVPDICPHYRHEFGSLLDIAHGCNGSPPPVEFASLSDDMKELVLHLIAAHHGRARPHFPADEAFDPDGNVAYCRDIAHAVPQRFARLQRKYGRWGLAYLESLLRAADWAASANPSEVMP